MIDIFIILLLVGVGLSLGLLTKTAYWFNFGKNFLAAPFCILKYVGFKRSFTWKVVATLCSLFCGYQVHLATSALGGLGKTFHVLLSHDTLGDRYLSHKIRRFLLTVLAFAAWIFVTYFYFVMENIHEKTLQKQRDNERRFLVETCLKTSKTM